MRSPFAMTPWVRRLLVANAVVYLLTVTVFTGGWFFQLFAFSPVTAARQPWSFFTYMFLHGGALHLLFNMLMLFFFGSAVEERMGGGAFARYYVFCGLGGAVFSFAIALMTPVMPFVGASGAVLGVALAFAMYWPDAPVLVFPIPFPIKVRWLVGFLAAIDLLLAISPSGDGVAHLAHLGGFLFGFLYLRGEALVGRRAGGALARRPPTRVLVHPSATSAREERQTTPPRSPRTDDSRHREIDRVLDKISASGIDSLTAEERRFLDESSREMRQH